MKSRDEILERIKLYQAMNDIALADTKKNAADWVVIGRRKQSILELKWVLDDV
jgi:hypothetical protein